MGLGDAPVRSHAFPLLFNYFFGLPDAAGRDYQTVALFAHLGKHRCPPRDLPHLQCNRSAISECGSMWRIRRPIASSILDVVEDAVEGDEEVVDQRLIHFSPRSAVAVSSHGASGQLSAKRRRNDVLWRVTALDVTTATEPAALASSTEHSKRLGGIAPLAQERLLQI